MNILIVDDSRAMRMIVRRTLRQTGIQLDTVEEAANGQEGLEKMAEFSPDLVLSDWNMPEMDGITFLTEVRSRGNRTPFVFVTSQASDEMRQQAMATGAQHFVTKPFTAETFEKIMSKFE